MAFNAVNPVSVGLATKKDHYDRVFDNTLELRTGGLSIASQALGAVVVGSTATQLKVIPITVPGQALRVSDAGTDVEFGEVETFAPGDPMNLAYGPRW